MMKRQKFKTEINAPREKVWDVLWNDATYRQWTAPFSEGSYAETDWKEGSKVLFLGPGGDGMVARISERRDNEYMGIEHLGMVENGVEDTESEKIQSWKGAQENYSLSTENGKTELTVETDITEEYLEEFEKVWPVALQKVKELSEKQPFRNSTATTKQFWLNLPVKDLARSIVFFEKIGFTPNPDYTNAEAASFLIGENDFVMMLFPQKAFQGLTQHKLADTDAGTEVLLNIDAQSSAEVDEMARIVGQAGGTIYAGPGESQGWMYACGFKDLDGHRWSVLHMDLSKTPQSEAAGNEGS